MNRELLGLRTEIVGLFLILFATIWQGTFTDWFDKTNQGWIAYTQETVNLSVLRALDDLSGQMQETDPDKRQKIRLEIYDNVSAATSAAIKEREARRALERGQAKVFSVIRYITLLIGAALVILGKWLVLAHKRAAAQLVSRASPPQSAA